MPAQLQPSEDLGPRKRQVPLDANGERGPATGPAPKKKKSVPEKTGKNKTAPAKPQKKAAPRKIVSTNAAPAKSRPSVDIEDEPDEDDLTYSERPHNLQNVLEAVADVSDDSDGVTGPPSTAMDIDADVNDSEVEDAIVEEAVEDDEAELGLYKSQYRKIYLQLNGRTHVQKMDFTGLCVLQKKTPDRVQE